MNIGYCLQGYPVKSQTWIPLEVKELERRGHHIEIIDVEKPLNRRIIKNCDFIICHFSFQGIHAKRWGIPYGVIAHAYDIWRDDGKSLTFASKSKNCKWIAGETQYHLDRYKNWDIDKPQIIIPLATDTELFYKKKNIGDKVVCGGRFKEKKGLEYAVKGYKDIHVYGKGESYLRKLKEINPDLTYHGWLSRDGLRDLLDECWLLVSPNLQARDGDMDGQPCVIREAMLMEMQVLTTPIAGIPELKYIHLSTPEEIAKGNIEIPKKRNVEGRLLIKNNFSPKIVVDKIMEAIESY